MTGVTHSRAAKRETPVLFEMHEQIKPRSRRDQLKAEYDELLDHRRIYLEGLGRYGLPDKKRLEFEAKLRGITRRLLELEVEMGK
jgi:hypothetical protein